MATAPTFPLVSVDEYLRTSYEPECEYIDGILEPKSLPSPPHSVLHYRLTNLLYARAQSNVFLPLTELRVPIGSRRFRVPDIALMPHEWLEDRKVIPLAVFELLSPDDKVGDLVNKTRDYHELGVKNIIAADPQQRAVFVADERGALQGRVPANVTLDLPDGPSLTIDFDELFAQVPQK